MFSQKDQIFILVYIFRKKITNILKPKFQLGKNVYYQVMVKID